MSETQISTPEDRISPVMRVLMSQKTEIALSAIAPKCNPAQLMARARLAVLEKPDLAECTPESILLSVKKAAASGFEPNSFGRDWYLVPRWNKAVGAKEAQFTVGWMGYVHLAKSAGLPFIKAEIVYDKDDFHLGADDKGCHIVHNFDPLKDRGQWAGVYSMTKDRRGNVDFEWMTKAEVMLIRARSAAKSGPWITDETEMAKKTVLRRHSKRWRLSPTAKEAIAGDDDRIDMEAAPLVKTARYKLEEPKQIPASSELSSGEPCGDGGSPPVSSQTTEQRRVTDASGAISDNAGGPHPDPVTGEFPWT